MLMASMEWAWKQSNFSVRFHDRCLPITLMFVFSMHVRMLDSSIKLVRSSPASKRKPKNTTPQWYLSSDIFFSICQRWLWCLLFSWRWIVWVEDHCSMKHNSWSINMNCIIHLHLSCTVSMLSARTTLDASKESVSESVDRREISLRWVGFENMETVLSMIEMGEWMNCFRCSGITLSCKESEK